jgi:hypothetical protein
MYHHHFLYHFLEQGEKERVCRIAPTHQKLQYLISSSYLLYLGKQQKSHCPRNNPTALHPKSDAPNAFDRSFNYIIAKIVWG